jgi:hypothetical protein
MAVRWAELLEPGHILPTSPLFPRVPQQVDDGARGVAATDIGAGRPTARDQRTFSWGLAPEVLWKLKGRLTVDPTAPAVGPASGRLTDDTKPADVGIAAQSRSKPPEQLIAQIRN